MTVIDSERAIADVNGRIFVLTRTDTKKFKNEMQLEDVWRVIPASASVELAVKGKLSPNMKYHVLEPISKGELEKYRKLYEEHLKSPLILVDKSATSGSFAVDHLALEQSLVKFDFKFADEKDDSDPKTNYRVGMTDTTRVILRIEEGKLTCVVMVYIIDKANDKCDANIFATINRSLLAADELPAAAFWFGAVCSMRSAEFKYAEKLDLADFQSTMFVSEFRGARLVQTSPPSTSLGTLHYSPPK